MDGNDQDIMQTLESKPKSTRTRKGKPKSTDKPNGKRSLNLSLPIEVYERLALHALADGKTISEIVSDLANTHLRRVHLTRTTTRTSE
jgi:hypothetical protein